MDNLNAYYDPALKEARLALLTVRPGFSFCRYDLAERESTALLFNLVRPRHVIHLAAQAGVRHSLIDPPRYVDANVTGFLNVLEGCRHHPVEHLIYASSSSVYGANARLPFAEDDPVEDPHSLYAATKRANELMAHTYARLFQVPASGLRFFTVYGPWGRPDMAYFGFTKAILEGRPIDVFNNGAMRRDFTYVDDVVQAILRLMHVPPKATPPHTLYNIGNHTPVELGRFIDVIEAALGHKANRVLRLMQPGDVPATYADVSKLAAAVGFAPKTPIEDGIGRFVAWYRAHYAVAAAEAA